MHSRIIGINMVPLNKLTFKPAQPFEAGVHGPGSFGTSLSFPLPSTIAGSIASIAYRRNLCDSIESLQSDSAEFSDTRTCLGKLFGGDFRLYTGFLKKNDNIYVYVNTSKFPTLNQLKTNPLCILRNLDNRDAQIDKVYARRIRYTGIALNRENKSVRERMIYSLESIIYHPDSVIYTILQVSDPTHIKDNTVLKIGSKSGIVRLEIDRKNIDLETLENGEYYAILTSPALLENNPFIKDAVILSNERVRKNIAASLINLDRRVEAKLHYVPKGEHEFSVQTVGWSLRHNRSRKPYLILPPGTLLEITVEDPINAIKISGDVHVIGFGLYSDIGWGTTVIFPKK